MLARLFKSCGTYRFSFSFSPTYLLLTPSECSWLFTAKEQLSKISGFQEKRFWRLALFQAEIQLFKLKGVHEYSLLTGKLYLELVVLERKQAPWSFLIASTNSQ
jgi:hypothetical protein